MDFVSTTMAFVKVRLRIMRWYSSDYLTWHCIGGQWLITSKGFHVKSGGGSEADINRNPHDHKDPEPKAPADGACGVASSRLCVVR